MFGCNFEVSGGVNRECFVSGIMAQAGGSSIIAGFDKKHRR